MSNPRTRGRIGSKKPLTEDELKARAKAQAAKFARTRAFFEGKQREKQGLPSGRAIGAQMSGDCDEDKLAQKKNELVAVLGRNVKPPCKAIGTDLSCPKNYKQALKKLKRLHPDKNNGCTELAAEMMKKYQECCYHQVDEGAGHTFVKWNANDKEWRNPAYPMWYETAETSARRRAEQDAEIDAIQAGFSRRKNDFSDSSPERDIEGKGQTPTSSGVESVDDIEELRRKFKAEGYEKYITRAEEEEERKRNAEIERKRKDEMEKKVTKIQALQRGRSSRRKTPSAALCRMCEAPGFYDPKCDLCPEGTGKTKRFRRHTSEDESSDFSLPSDIGSSEPESMEKRYPPPARKRDSSADADFDCGSLNAPSGWIDMRSKRQRQDNRKTCRKKSSCRLDKHKKKNKSRCVTRKKGRKKKKRKPKRICAETKDCPENQICKDNFCVPVEAGMVRPVGAALPRTDPGAILRGEAATVKGKKSAAALQRADEIRRERILDKDGDIAPPRPSNIGPKADARAEEARDPMVDFHSYLLSDDCPKLTAKEIKDLANLFD